ncbi:MAG: LysR family transcriptional regulator [Myxococcales bacterium]|nr:LysR family transcriptional regulator [Myxococcales bacterium]
MDRLDAMRAFVTVAELHGFAPAARKLGISASATTRLVAALEERLGIRLLQRTTRRVSLTDAGARYLERAARILEDVDEAEGAAQAARLEPTGRFVVSAPLVFGRVRVAPVMCAFLARYPAVVGELVLADRMLDLVDEGVDVAVRIGHLADAGLVARRVGATRRVLVGAPSYLATRTRPAAPSDLAGHDVIQCTAITPGHEWLFGHGASLTRVPIAPRFVTNSADAAIGHASLGFGLSVVLAYQVEEAVRAGSLEVLLADHEPPALPIHLVFATKRHLSANVRVFTDWVVQTVVWDF